MRIRTLATVTGFALVLQMVMLAPLAGAQTTTKGTSAVTLAVAQTPIGPGLPIKLSGGLTLTPATPPVTPPTLSGREIVIARTVAGQGQWVKQGTATTDTAGRFAFTAKGAEWGDYEFRAQYLGDAEFAGSQAKVMVEVKLVTTHISFSAPQVVDYGEVAVVTAHFSHYDVAKPMKMTITAKHYGEAEEVLASQVPNANGNVTVAHPLAKTTKFTATWPGDGTYRPEESVVFVEARARITGTMIGYHSTSGVFHLFHRFDDPRYRARIVPTHAGDEFVFTLWMWHGVDQHWAWVKNVTRTISSVGTATVKFMDPTPGVGYRVHATFMGDDMNAMTDGPYDYFKVITT
jgi:hypothetical protein